jgi:hypothetical protein
MSCSSHAAFSRGLLPRPLPVRPPWPRPQRHPWWNRPRHPRIPPGRGVSATLGSQPPVRHFAFHIGILPNFSEKRLAGFCPYFGSKALCLDGFRCVMRMSSPRVGRLIFWNSPQKIQKFPIYYIRNFKIRQALNRDLAKNSPFTKWGSEKNSHRNVIFPSNGGIFPKSGNTVLPRNTGHASAARRIGRLDQIRLDQPNI